MIGYGDNADPKPDLQLQGTVNTSVPGDYPLRVKVTDSSGNWTRWSLTVSVVDEIPETEPTEDIHYFSDFRKTYAKEGRKFGIDVSAWQGDIDFDAVKDAGCEFVFMRVGYSYLGKLTVDKKFHQNLEGAKKAGLPVGIYLYSYDNNEEDVIRAVDAMFRELGDVELELPVVFDWEEFGDFQTYEMSFGMLNHLYDVFEREVELRGYESMLYGSKNFLQNIWTHTDTRPIWLAQYRSRPTYEGHYEFWQYTWRGRINGINGDADFDIMYTE